MWRPTEPSDFLEVFEHFMTQNVATARPDSTLSAVKFKELMGFNGVEVKYTMRGNVFYGLKKKDPPLNKRMTPMKDYEGIFADFLSWTIFSLT